MLLALLIAASADIHGSVGLGAGNGYDLLGARVEVGYGRLSAAGAWSRSSSSWALGQR
jgi:hypothetical protein